MPFFSSFLSSLFAYIPYYQDSDLVSRVEMLMDHVDDMAANPLLMSMWRDAAVTPLTTKLPASPYTEGDILHAVGVLQTNTISLAVPGQKTGLYTGLYPTFSFLSHRCMCNAKYVFFIRK